MIEPKEIRQGNRFFTIPEGSNISFPDKTTIYKAVSVGHFDLEAIEHTLIPAQMRVWNVFKYKQLWPIEITENWLVNLGFEKNITDWNIIWTKKEFGLSFEDNKYEFAYSISKEVKYIHELQNLYFAITGEELF